MSSSKEKPVLSISLLCSGRSETTEKCLKSVQSIKDQMPTEIVVVDTGCDKATREIVDKYADKVVPFEWCDDFSAARNAGLKECRGEWFLYLDDDEWFEDVHPIVDFFTSGDYKNYYYACYLQRNYQDWDSKRYEDSWVSRLIMLTAETRFHGCIHEYLEPIGYPEKLIKTYVNHYGYIFKDKEELYQHSRRNVPPLLKMMKEEPSSLRWPLQLSQEYYALDDYTSMKKLCSMMLDHIKYEDEPYANVSRGNYYIGIIWSLSGEYQWDEVIKCSSEYIKDKRNTDLCNAELCIYCSAAYYNTKQYENALKCTKKYLDIYKAWKGKPNYDREFNNADTILTHDVFLGNSYHAVLDIAILAGLEVNNPVPLYRYYREIAEDDYDKTRRASIYKDTIDFLSRNEFDKRSVEVCNELYVSDSMSEVGILECQSIESGNPEGFSRLLRVFYDVDSTHPYITYMHLRYADEQGLDADYGALFESMIEKTDDVYNLNPVVWEIAKRHQVDLKPVFSAIPSQRFMAETDRLWASGDAKVQDALSAVIDRIASEDESGGNRFGYFILKRDEAEFLDQVRQRRIASQQDKQKEEEYDKKAGKTHARKHWMYGQTMSFGRLHELVKDFCQEMVDFYRLVYRRESFEGQMDFLPADCRAAVKILEAIEPGTKEDSTGVALVKRLEQCKGITPAADEVINEYLHFFKIQQKYELIKENREKGIAQIRELLSVLDEAVPLFEKTRDSQLEAAIGGFRSQIEGILSQIRGKNLRPEISSATDNEWLSTVKGILSVLDRPLMPVSERRHKEAVFMPYKASMWDSLESVWKAAAEDPDWDVYVVPIPYFHKNEDESFGEMHYEGTELPDEVPVLMYDEYDLAARHPDMIFIHNPYDDFNVVTSVSPEYYSDRLAENTEALTYIPYYLFTDSANPDRGTSRDWLWGFCGTPAFVNARHVCLESPHFRQEYIETLCEHYGEQTRKRWEDTLIALGSPKTDRAINTTAADVMIPEKWRQVLFKEDGTKKKTILYLTSLSAYLHAQGRMEPKLKSILDFLKEKSDQVALIWRPHPLLEETLETMRPEEYLVYEETVRRYRDEGWGIYDDSSDLERAMAISDVYYGDWSSVTWLYKDTGKDLLMQSLEVNFPSPDLQSDEVKKFCTAPDIYGEGANLNICSLVQLLSEGNLPEAKKPESHIGSDIWNYLSSQ